MSGGYSAASMLYIVAIFLGVYAVGMVIYLSVQLVRKLKARKQFRGGENG